MRTNSGKVRGFGSEFGVRNNTVFNAIPDTSHNANPTNPNHNSKGNPNPTKATNPTNLYYVPL